MHYFGYIIYAIVIMSIAFVPAANTLVVTSYELATEITVGCLVIAVYPPLQFLYYNIRGMRQQVHFERMCSVSQTCGNTVVSLGLIGTFVGLTQMIEKIAGAIGGEGGSLDEQIAIIMTAIGESLDAMSFAFLTSVMGVAASVTIFAASVYFKMYFDQNEAEDESVVTDEAMEDRLSKIEGEATKVRQFLSRVINNSIDRTEMASIIVSNSLQLKEIASSSAKLSKSIESQIETNMELRELIKNLTGTLSEITESQASSLKFESASHAELQKLTKGLNTALEQQTKDEARVKGAISAICNGLNSLK